MTRVLVVLLLSLSLAGAQETRYHQLSRRAKGSGGAVRIVSATWLGGPGAEELVATCWQPGGTLLAVGNAWGPDLPGARVFGPDGYRDAPVWADEAKRRLDRANPNLAGCLWRLSADLSRADTVVRLGWGTGVVTSAAVGGDGAVYLGGLGRDALLNWARSQPGSRQQPPDTAAAGGSHLFLMRLSADLARVDWITTFERAERQAADVERPVGGRVGLRFRFTAERDLVAQAYGRLYRLDAGNGAARELATLRGGVLLSADPASGRIYCGGDENTNTGREPWRRPFLTACDRNGTLLWQAWRWDAKRVGGDEYRLVSDSSVRGLLPLDGDRALTWGWSDGGNSVFLRQPTDLDQRASFAGSFCESLWGAGVGSFGWLMTLDTAKVQTLAGTNVAAFFPTRDRPNSSRIDGACRLSGGRLAVVGSSAFAFVETPDAWVKTYPDGAGGAYFAIYSESLGDLLFGSLLPGIESPLALARRDGRVAVVGTGVQPVDPAAKQPPLASGVQTSLRGPADGYVLVAEVGR